jgi:hypothetical protein
MSDTSSLEWMLWLIEDAQEDELPLVVLIQAILYYNEKYGCVPNRCEVPPGWADDLKAPPGMQVQQTSSVPPGHLRLALDPGLDGSDFSGLPLKRPA